MSGEEAEVDEGSVGADEPDPDAPAASETATENAQLFGVWDVTEISYADPSTKRYMTVTPIAHTMGRHASKQFKKSEISLVERLINRLMQTDENTGKKYGGISVPKAVDVAPQRRVDQALLFISDGVANATYKSTTSAAEALAQELIGAADYDVQTYSISQKEERERVAAAAR